MKGHRLTFDGVEFVPELDEGRLTGHLGKIFCLMKDGEWRTLREINTETGSPEASVSAHLRSLRKPRFGGHEIARRRRGSPTEGLFEYRLESSPQEVLEDHDSDLPTDKGLVQLDLEYKLRRFLEET